MVSFAAKEAELSSMERAAHNQRESKRRMGFSDAKIHTARSGTASAIVLERVGATRATPSVGRSPAVPTAKRGRLIVGPITPSFESA